MDMKLIDLNSLPQEKPSRQSESDIDQILEALPHDHTALQLGQALYRCKSLSWRERWHIGKHILQFESPKLGVIANVSEQDFATLLDRRLKRISELEANGNPPQQTINQRQIEQPTIETTKPLSRTADRRFRRM
jgi:hypothetical protein